MTDADELRCKHCKREYDRRQEKKCKGYCFDCWNCGVPELIEDRDRLAAENARLRAELEDIEVLAGKGGPSMDTLRAIGKVAREALTRKEQP